jgi:hypothetical protein
MLLVLLTEVMMAGVIIRLLLLRNSSQDAVKATVHHCDLQEKFWQMFDDPATTKADWAAMLPEAQKSDEWWQKTHPTSLPGTMSLESWVLAFSS